MKTVIMKSVCFIVTVFVLFIIAGPAKALTATEAQKLLASDGGANDFELFGCSVAVDGDTAVIGAPELNAEFIGSAYVFTRNSDGVWTEQQKLMASESTIYLQFGTSVAFDGNTIVIGTDNITYNGNAILPGVYVFTRNSDGEWTERAKLTPSEPSGSFGRFSVAVDGDTVISKAYVFTRNSNGEWTEQAKLTTSESVGSVAVDGDTAVIGAMWDENDNGNRSGSAYVFTRSGGVWTEQQKLTASDGAYGDNFGNSVALDGDTAVIGARYNEANDEDSGAAYVFTRSGVTWVEHQKLTASDGAENDVFGYSVAFDGDTAVIGAYGDEDLSHMSGSAYVFDSTVLDFDGDGYPNASDNCPNIANPDQSDSDYDGEGDACDSEFNEETVVDALEDESSTCVDTLNEANPPGVDGMINKISGNGGVANKVNKAVADYTDGRIDTETYLDRLYEAMDKLDSFDNQLTAKINNGQIVEPEASELWLYSSNMREMINNLINDAMSS